MIKKLRHLLIFLPLYFLFACSILPPSGDQEITQPVVKNSFTDFTISVDYNPHLSRDVLGVIEGTDIVLYIPKNKNITALIPTFTSNGKFVKVGGVNQESGTTPSDFSSPVTYTSVDHDESKKVYTVSVEPLYAEENTIFDSASTIGDSAQMHLIDAILDVKMIYANNKSNLNFPKGVDDNEVGALNKKFWMAETELTNSVAAAVLQWAYDQGRFSKVGGSHNEISTVTVKHGIRELLKLGNTNCHVKFDGIDTFTVDGGFKNNPVNMISWYGAVMISNWITEMRDGHTENLVFTGIEQNWLQSKTLEDTSKTGYRLPTSQEWEYAARYRGSDPTNVVSLSGIPYYTKGDSASHATANYLDTVATSLVAIYADQTPPKPTIHKEVKILSSGNNSLGLYDMSGNVFEWCSNKYITDSFRTVKGGGYLSTKEKLRIGLNSELPLGSSFFEVGFRLARTATH